MASNQDVAVLAFSVADGCSKILVPLLCFLGGSGTSPRSPAADEAAVFLLLVLPVAYVAGAIVAHLAGVVLAYLRLVAAAPAPASANLARFVVLVSTLVLAWLLLIAATIAAFSFFFGAGRRGIGTNQLLS